MKFVAAIVLCVTALIIAACSSVKQQSGSLASQRATVIDVRSEDEYKTAHLPGTVNIPINQLETRIQEVAPSKDAPLGVHCQSGGRSARAKALLDKLGYTNVEDLGSYENAKSRIAAAD